jgi:hypothetical protein
MLDNVLLPFNRAICMFDGQGDSEVPFGWLVVEEVVKF